MALRGSCGGQARPDHRLSPHHPAGLLRSAAFPHEAIRRHGTPEQITVNGSEANAAAIKRYNTTHGTAIGIRQVRYLNNIVEQDHRAVKRVVRPMLGFKSHKTAQPTTAGVELVHMLKKGQLVTGEGEPRLTPAEQFYTLEPIPTPEGIHENVMTDIAPCEIIAPPPEGRSSSSGGGSSA